MSCPSTSNGKLFSIVRVALALFGLMLTAPSPVTAVTPHHGHQVTFSNPQHHAGSNPPHKSAERPLKVAVIGGGAAGTSSAFFLSHLAGQAGRQVDVRLFERRDYLGGRSTLVFPFDDKEAYDPVEAGASIFVDANKNLQKAVKAFNLTTIKYGGENDGGRWGIWDGTEFGWEESGGWGWWDSVRLLWRYGRAPLVMESLKNTAVKSFVSVYSADFIKAGPFDTIPGWVNQLGPEFAHYPTLTASDFLIDEHNLNVLCINELAEVATRVNYGTDVSDIHALGVLVSLATGGAVAVKGGNRQLYSHFAERSGAKVALGVEVTSLNRTESPRGALELTFRDAGGEASAATATEHFDAVILAAPYHQTRIAFPSAFAPVPQQAYVHLFVTFIATNASSPSPSAFKRDDAVPNSVYSTMMRHVEGRGERPKFNSLSYLRNIGKREGVEGDVHVVKMFSEAPLDDKLLSELFGGPANVIWTKRIEWDAYPFLQPLAQSEFAPFHLAEGVYYVNGFERVISTMETQTAAAWNVAGLVAQDFWGYKASASWAEGED